MSDTSEFDQFHDIPSWFDDVGAALAYSDHLVLSGNVGDVFPSPLAPRQSFQPLTPTLWTLISNAGYRAMLRHDPVQGLTVVHASGEAERQTLTAAGLSDQPGPMTLEALAALQARIAGFTDFPVALIMDYASHLPREDRASLAAFFIAIDRQSRERRQARDSRPANPTIWIVDHPADMPDWFVLNNAALREIQLERPTLEVRFHFARHLAQRLSWTGPVPDETQDRLLQQFALECDGKPLTAMEAIAEVAIAEGLGLERISDAIRVFRTGTRRNPWTSPVLRDRMRSAEALLGERIKGQPHAIEKVLDILARSILGLSGAQSGSAHTRPRGALFFVGPTGVGKTELAKAITHLLFGDDSLCHRFDMSEFMEENSVSRLIGAPPGHPGHEKGGELVNAALRRPFSVFLFDEVEKAHPRVLDLFLQILDEGRLTDARGATAYFSEALVIFTSNIGMTKGSRETNMGMNVLPSDSHEELAAKIRQAVEEHFRNELRRPELLNRIGQNVVAFDFLDGAGMSAIFDAIVGRVIRHVETEHQIRIELMPEAAQALKSMCTQDFFDGGRGIANRIETHFINPLARQLFLTGRPTDLCIAGVSLQDGRTVFELDTTRPQADSRPRPSEPKPLPLPGRWRSRFETR